MVMVELMGGKYEEWLRC